MGGSGLRDGGTCASHGRIRLADDDIDLVYSLMAAGQSTVVIRP